jgi:dolichol-phosphate mannosyltransferase
MIAVVIPSFRVKAHILDVLAGIGPEVAKIYVVDDACPEGSGKHAETGCHDPRVKVLYHPVNRGVGGATLTGFLRARQDGAQIAIKLDGDGQMDAKRIPALARELVAGRADYAKGNRFFAPDFLSQMPKHRLLGNSVLSFITKISSGYWRVMDPTNGFLAIQTKLFDVLPMGKLAPGYFFESDLLFRLNTIRAVVVDVPMHAQYGTEKSNLRVSKVAYSFASSHVRCFFKRIFYNYFLRDFNVGSAQLLVGTALTVFGAVYGGLAWYTNAHAGRMSPVGTVMIAVLPILVGIQMLLSAVNYDILNEPRTPLHPQL